MTMLSEYIFIGSTIAGLLWLRKVRPDASRPIKVKCNKFFFDSKKNTSLSRAKLTFY